MPPIRPASAKAKGRRFQQDVRALLIKHLALDPADIVSRPMGSPGEDLIMGVESRRKFPYSVECKNRKSMKEVYEKSYDQAEANCPEGSEPLLLIRTDYRRPLAILDLEHFLKLVRVALSNMAEFDNEERQ